MAANYPSSTARYNLSTHGDFKICPQYQEEPSSCQPFSCEDLHMCDDYLLTGKCKQFELHGKCSHSHSFFTFHNQHVLDRKFQLSATDKQLYEKVSQMIRRSMPEDQARLYSSGKILSRFYSHPISTDDVDLTREQTKTSPYRQPSRTTAVRDRSRISIFQTVLTSSSPEKTSPPLSTKQPYTHERKSRISRRVSPPDSSKLAAPSRSKSNITSRSLHLDTDELDTPMASEKILSRKHSSNRLKPSRTTDYSSSSDEKDTGVGIPQLSKPVTLEKKSLSPFTLGNYQPKKKMNLFASESKVSITSRTPTKYVFNKYLQNTDLCYLHGPVRWELVEHEEYDISSSGYAQLSTTNEEKQLDKKIAALLPIKLNTDPVMFSKEEIALIIPTSAAERLFEENQSSFGIMSTSYTAFLDIEVIHPPKSDRVRSSSRPPTNVLSPRPSGRKEKSYASLSNGKYRIASSNSSIDVINGDITQTKVDLMVCVTTSTTLLTNVLTQAGSRVASEYNERFLNENPILLDGGSTSAKKILFLAWELEVKLSNMKKAETSLSALVKRCIRDAYHLKMTSISFPSIGIGQIGLDTDKVCRLMIDAAIERLDQYTMDVLFVIYPSHERKHKEQPYQIFRSYLDDIFKQSKSIKLERSPAGRASQSTTIPIEVRQYIKRTLKCAHISTVSHSLGTTAYHSRLVDALEKLIKEKIYDLSLVQQLFISRIELLIDVCLEYHVLPHINLSQDKLILRGDRDSCSQCFANLQQQRLIHKYSVAIKTDTTDDEIKMNTYESMRIDEARVVGDSKIRIDRDDKTIFEIDLTTLQVSVDRDAQMGILHMLQINSDAKIVPPRTWSPSTLMIRTVDLSRLSFSSIECVRIFEETMPRSEWHIEQIRSIENWPLYVHFTRKKTTHDVAVFHGCSFSMVQSIIHYGLHSTSDSIPLTRDAWHSHIDGACRSTRGKYYMFAVLLSKKIANQDTILLSNEESHLALPTHLIVYKR